MRKPVTAFIEEGQTQERLLALARASRRERTLLVIDRPTLGQLIDEVGGEEQAAAFIGSLPAAARYPVASLSLNEASQMEAWVLVPADWTLRRAEQFQAQFRGALSSLGVPVLYFQTKPDRSN